MPLEIRLGHYVVSAAGTSKVLVLHFVVSGTMVLRAVSCLTQGARNVRLNQRFTGDWVPLQFAFWRKDGCGQMFLVLGGTIGSRYT